MAKMGGRKQLKRYSMPSVMRLPVKSSKWITKPMPGPHPANRCIPLRIIIRDYLKMAKTAKEADRIISWAKILVDGKVRREPRFTVGFMDILHIPDIKKTYRVLIDTLGRFKLIEIEESEGNRKLCRVVNKQTIRGGKIQLTMHDGRNVVGDLNNIRIGDTIVLSIPEGKILDHIPLSEGKIAIITEGKNVGRVEKKKEKRKKTKTAILSTDGDILETPLNYVFVIGNEKPLINLEGIS